ncbi:hypothetical protein Aperf_G00000116110 [Anoplocephala perfoliata]
MDLSVDELTAQSRFKRRMGVWKSQKLLRNVRGGRIQKRRSLPSRWRKQQMFQKKDANASAAARTQLIVSNLHYAVSNADIRELFQELGTIYRAAVHYDRSGRSTGIAEVTYTNRASAVQAIERYNGVPLDGRPMNIQLLREDGNKSIATAAAARMRLGTAATRGRQPPRGPRGTHGGRSDSGPHNNRNIRAPVTKEQLDAELAAYFAQVIHYTDFHYISSHIYSLNAHSNSNSILLPHRSPRDGAVSNAPHCQLVLLRMPSSAIFPPLTSYPSFYAPRRHSHL